jgi:cell division septation protein DedD
LIGQRYALVRQLREEPWGAVWLARDQLLETEVGLKLCPREALDWPEGRRILEQEAVWGLKLRHPGILGVYFLGQAGKDLLYLVQEPFLGGSLLVRLTRQQHFSLSQALQLLERLGEALAFAHRLGVSHHSLSPLAVLLLGDEVRLANFAFPSADSDQVIHLELKAYEPPEVLQGGALTPAGNVFSLGVLGFRLVAGSLPYPLTFDEPFPYRLEDLPADLEEIPLPLQNFLLQCLSADPEERLPDATAFTAQLRQVREHMEPRRPQALVREKAGPQRMRQAAAQAGAVLEKLREAGKPLSAKVGEGTRASLNLVKAASRRVWLGVGLAVLVMVLLVWGGVKSGRPPETPPPAPGAKTAAPAKNVPVSMAPMGAGPPLVAGEESGAPPAPRPGPGSAPVTPAATPGAKKPKDAAQERYLLVAATYSSTKQAQALAQRLKARKYRAKVVSRTTGGKTLYQVQVGPVTGVKAAEELAGNLKAQEKITPKVVKMANKTSSKPPKKSGAPLSRRPAG